MVEKVGQDEFGKTLKSSLKNDGVNVDYFFEKEGIPTGIAAIIVEKSETMQLRWHLEQISN